VRGVTDARASDSTASSPSAGARGLRLDGKVAVITGGSRGIGFGIARAFVDAGAQVMLVARKAETLEEAAAELGPAASWRVAHAAKQEEAAASIADTIERLGSVDVLVNNAATNPYAGPTIDIDVARWDKTFETNVRGPLVWTQEAWKQWMKEHGGSVINISSVGAFHTSAALGCYGTAKAALVYLTQQLAGELAPKVRVNCLAPGLIKTDFAKYLWQDGKGDVVAKGYPLKRLGESDDIAEAALYFAAGAGWVTGQTLILDGGGTIRIDTGRVE
jgi:NAD(P)-dependent dehydrogenase (short-subunit alcohol dehydrogenase family)